MGDENNKELYAILHSFLGNNGEYRVFVDPATNDTTITRYLENYDGEDLLEYIDCDFDAETGVYTQKTEVEKKFDTMRDQLSKEIDVEYEKIKKVISDMIDHKIDKIMISVVEALKEKNIQAEVDRRVEERLQKIKALL